MRLIYVILALLLFIESDILAQHGKIDTLIVKYVPPGDTIKYWKLDGNLALTFQHVNFHNWVKGGNPNISFATALNLTAIREKNNNIFSNQLDLGYGIIREGGSERNFRKNNDFIIYIGKFGKNIFDKWYLEGIIDFRTQFTKGYKYDKEGNKTAWSSNIFSPAQIKPSLGLSYKKKNFSFSGSPISGKITVVLNDSLTYISENGVDPLQNVKSEVGASITITDKTDIMKNVSLRYNFSLFSNYRTIFQYMPDINGEIYLRFKVNKYISSFFNMRMIYDNSVTLPELNDAGEEIGRFTPFQVNYTFNIGFSVDLWGD